MASSSSKNASSTEVKTYLKTPEGRCKILYETRPKGITHDSRSKWVSQLTIAHLKENVATHVSSTSPSKTASSFIGVKAALSKLFVDITVIKSPSLGGSSGGRSFVVANYDEKGTYLIFNAGDWLIISDIDMQNQVRMKYIHFGSSEPSCHAFDSEAKDDHDLVVGLRSGEIYTASLRRQLKDSDWILVGAQHYNKNGEINGSCCTCVAWVPGGEGNFVAAHADGNLYVYKKCNPTSRWHNFQGPINGISFSTDGLYLAIVGRDGYLRVFDYLNGELSFGGKSYAGGLLCCAWSPDDKYIVTGGEDDFVQVWSTYSRKMVAYGEGHHSWVSGISFDSYRTASNSDRAEDNVVYRFGSVGQDGRLLIWKLENGEISEQQAHIQPPSGDSLTLDEGSSSVHEDVMPPPLSAALQPSPSLHKLAKLSPVGCNRLHDQPLNSIIFAEDSVAVISRGGHIQIWARPDGAETSQAS